MSREIFSIAFGADEDYDVPVTRASDDNISQSKYIDRFREHARVEIFGRSTSSSATAQENSIEDLYPRKEDAERGVNPPFALFHYKGRYYFYSTCSFLTEIWNTFLKHEKDHCVPPLECARVLNSLFNFFNWYLKCCSECDRLEYDTIYFISKHWKNM